VRGAQPGSEPLESEQAAELAVAIDGKRELLVPLHRHPLHELVEIPRAEVVEDLVPELLDPAPNARESFKRKRAFDGDLHDLTTSTDLTMLEQ
jgi:hypothetical protein